MLVNTTEGCFGIPLMLLSGYFHQKHKDAEIFSQLRFQGNWDGSRVIGTGREGVIHHLPCHLPINPYHASQYHWGLFCYPADAALWLLSSLKHKDAKIFGNQLNPVMLVFIGKLSLSIIRWVPNRHSFSHFFQFPIFCIILYWPNPPPAA